MSSVAPTAPLVPVEEYLSTSYEHDKEFVDGVLADRSMPTYAHGVLQWLICVYLSRYRKEFHFGLSTECRVELVERSRYRIPDVLLATLPVPNEKVLRTVPLAVIEIWSPDDRLAQQMARFREYLNRGVREIILLDPEGFVAMRYSDGALTECVIEHIELPDGRQIPFSSAELFTELRSELEREA